MDYYLLDSKTGNWTPVDDNHTILELPKGITPDDEFEIEDHGMSLIGIIERDAAR